MRLFIGPQEGWPGEKAVADWCVLRASPCEIRVESAEEVFKKEEKRLAKICLYPLERCLGSWQKLK